MPQGAVIPLHRPTARYMGQNAPTDRSVGPKAPTYPPHSPADAAPAWYVGKSLLGTHIPEGDTRHHEILS